MKIAVLFDNLGPYHVARINAAAESADVLGVEYAAVSNEYAWERRAGAVQFQRATLFETRPSRRLPASELVDRLGVALGGFGPDGVAVPGWSGRLAFAALSWCLRNDVPAIVMSESSAHDAGRWRWREAIKRRCLATCGAGLVGGEPQREYLVQLGMPAERVFLGYDVVDNSHFARGAAGAQSEATARRQQLDLPERYLLASARFIAKKNLAALVKAYAQYRVATADPWDLVILGDGKLRAGLETLRDQLGLNSHIRMPGFKQYAELPAYYGLASAFIHASTVEQWGLVVNEAMAAGLPVLVSRRCGCASTLVREGENGATFDPESVDQIVACLRDVTSLSDAQRTAMGRASQKIVSEFGPARFAEGLCRAAEAAQGLEGSRRRFGDALLMRTLLASDR